MKVTTRLGIRPSANRIRFTLASSAALLTAALASQVAADDTAKFWTAAASTGAFDKASADSIAFSGPFATLSASASCVAQVVLRYNVVAVDGLFSQAGLTTWPNLMVNYRDDGAAARVLVYLREYEFGANPMSPVLNTRIVFDSDLFPASPNYQTRTVGNCNAFSDFQFIPSSDNARAYYLEVLLSRNGVDGNPAVGAFSLSRSNVCLASPKGSVIRPTLDPSIGFVE